MSGLSSETVKLGKPVDELFVDLPYHSTNWPSKTENRKGDGLVRGICELSKD
jgi:hypothetical protein